MGTSINTNYENHTYCNNDNNKQAGETPRNVSIFNALANLYDDKDDGNKITENDIWNANKLMEKFDCIKQIRKDPRAGIIRIFFNDGSKLECDIETEAEKDVRIVQEKFAETEARLNSYNNQVHMQRQVELAKERYGKNYDIEIEKDANGKETGYVLVTAKKETVIYKIKEQLCPNIADGMLTLCNPDIQERDDAKREEIANWSSFRRSLSGDINGHLGDNQNVEVGRTIRIPAEDLDVKKGLFQ